MEKYTTADFPMGEWFDVYEAGIDIPDTFKFHLKKLAFIRMPAHQTKPSKSLIIHLPLIWSKKIYSLLIYKIEEYFF